MRCSAAMLWLAALFVALPPTVLGQVATHSVPPNTALLNGQWFDGHSFKKRTLYSVDGRFTTEKPARIDHTLDLAGLWMVPPFGEGHNHNLGWGVEKLEKEAIQRYLTDGVFYVKIQGNLPLSNQQKEALGINRPQSIDVIFAQGQITAPGGHPAGLINNILLPHGVYPGYTAESLVDYRYFPIASEQELNRKWPAILSQGHDFIKVIISFSEEFEKRKDDPAYFGLRGLDPRMLPVVVEKAHAAQLRVSVHVNTATDFHYAVVSGADEIAHVPISAVTPISAEDAALAATKGIIVDTTCEVVPHLPPGYADDMPQILRTHRANLKLLHDHGVVLAIGSDTPQDSSRNEVEYLRGLGIFDDLTLLTMWSKTTPQSIFPGRKIGAFQEGYEASFLALEGNPMEDWKNTAKIRIRFKQGYVVKESTHSPH